MGEAELSERTFRQAWDEIEWKVEDRVHRLIWFEVSRAKEHTDLPWWEITDAISDQVWRSFSPEVSGNVL